MTAASLSPVEGGSMASCCLASGVEVGNCWISSNALIAGDLQKNRFQKALKYLLILCLACTYGTFSLHSDDFLLLEDVEDSISQGHELALGRN